MYLVLVEKVTARTAPIQGFGRLVRVRSGRTATVPPVAPGSAAARRGLAAVAGAAAYRATAGQPAVAVKYFTGSGPNAFLGKGLADMILTGLVGSRCYVVVEWERRGDILAELRLQQSKYVDPSTRVTPRLIQPTIFVEGSVSTTASSTSWNIRVRDVATGTIIGSDSGSAGANLFDAVDAAARRLREQLEKELCLPTRFQGSFSGRIGGPNAGGLGGGGMTFTGTITFVRSRDQSLAAPGFIHYSVQSVAFTSTVTLELPGGCSGTDTGTASLRNEDPRISALALAKRITPNKGRAYAIVTIHQRPDPLNLTLTCPSGPTFVTPWTPAAAISTVLGGDYYLEGNRLRGTNNGQAPATYSWDLTGSS